MRDDEGGAACGEPVGGGQDRRLGGRVQGGGGLVEQQQVRVDQLGAGQRDQLPLPGGQALPALVDRLAKSVR